MSFNWRTDEAWDEDDFEALSDEGVLVETTAVLPQRRRRWWQFLLVALVLIGVSSLLILRQVDRQVNSTVAAVERDVAATHRLILQMEGARDVDLFRASLSGRDGRWAQAYEALAKRGAVFDRTALGWVQMGEVSTPTVTLAPDLSSAEVTFEQWYQVGERRVPLQQTAVYRKGGDRWLFSPPLPAFWGSWETVEGKIITVVYPARDGEVAMRLQADLEQQVAAMCQLVVACPDNLEMLLRFDTNGASLTRDLLNPSVQWSQGRWQVVLPTPTLLGAPVDEAGYQLLLQHYSRRLVAIVIADLVDYRCCINQPFFEMLLSQQLQQLDLEAWPVTSEQYAMLQREGVTLPEMVAQVGEWWHEPSLFDVMPEAWWRTQVFLEFAMSLDPKVTPTTLQSRLHARSSYERLLDDLIVRNSAVQNSTVAVEERWLRFVQQKSGAMAAIPLPEEALLVVCDSRLLRYTPVTDSWTDEGLSMSITQMSPLLDDSGVFVQGNQDRWQAVIWQDGAARLQYRPTVKPGVLFYEGRLGKNGRFLQIVSASQTTSETTYEYFDLANCADGVCQPERREGNVKWSPAGDQSLMLTWQQYKNGVNAYELQYGREADGARQIVGVVNDAFWVDNVTYGILQTEDAGQTLSLIDAGTGDVVGRVPEIGPQLMIDEVFVNPSDSNQIFLLATNYFSRAVSGLPGDKLLRYDRAGDRVWVALSLPPNALLWGREPIRFAPNGEWLAVSTADREETAVDVLLYHIASGEFEPIGLGGMTIHSRFGFRGFDWSADGTWLALISEAGLVLRSVDGYYEQEVPGFSTCSSLAWVDDR